MFDITKLLPDIAALTGQDDNDPNGSVVPGSKAVPGTAAARIGARLGAKVQPNTVSPFKPWGFANLLPGQPKPQASPPATTGFETPMEAFQKLLRGPTLNTGRPPRSQPSILDQLKPTVVPRQAPKPDQKWLDALKNVSWKPKPGGYMGLGIPEPEEAKPKTLLPLGPSGPYLHYGDYVYHSHLGHLHIPTYDGAGNVTGSIPTEQAQSLITRHWGPGYAYVPVVGMNDDEDQIKASYTNFGQFPTAEEVAAQKAAQARSLTPAQREYARGTGPLIFSAVPRLVDAAVGTAARALAGPNNPPETYQFFSDAAKTGLNFTPYGGARALGDTLAAGSDSALQGNAKPLRDLGQSYLDSISPVKDGRLNPAGVFGLALLLGSGAHQTLKAFGEDGLVRNMMNAHGMSRGEAQNTLSIAREHLARLGYHGDLPTALDTASRDLGTSHSPPAQRDIGSAASGPPKLPPEPGGAIVPAKTPSESRGLSNSEPRIWESRGGGVSKPDAKFRNALAQLANRGGGNPDRVVELGVSAGHEPANARAFVEQALDHAQRLADTNSEYGPTTQGDQPGDAATARTASRAAQRIRSDFPAVISSKDSPDAMEQKLHDQVTRELESTNSPGFRSVFRDMVRETNERVSGWIQNQFGRKPTDGELGLFHLLSAMGSPSRDSYFDTSQGFRLFERYIRDGQISPYVGDGQLHESNIFGKAKSAGIPDINDGLVRPGKRSVEYADEGVLRFNNLLHNFGGDMERAVRWLQDKHPVGEIERLTGGKVGKSEFVDYGQTYGAMGLSGPKIGAYWLNRMGDLSVTTKDAWIGRQIARYFGNPLIKDGKLLTIVGSPLSSLQTRQMLDRVWGRIANERGLEPADVQERMWQFERELYNRYGWRPGNADMLQGLEHSIREVEKGNGFDRYESGRPATESEISAHKVWRVLSGQRRRFYAGTSESPGEGYRMDSAPSGMGRHPGLEGRGNGRIPFGPGHRIGDRASTGRVDKYEPSPQFVSALHELGGKPEIYHSPQGAYDDLNSFKEFESASGATRFAVRGDRLAVISNSSKDPTAIHGAVQLAIDTGVRRVSVRDTGAPYTLGEMGFRAVARVPLDESHVSSEAIPGQASKYKGGRPDTVYMVWDPAYNKAYKPGDGKLLGPGEYDLAEKRQINEVNRLRTKYERHRAKGTIQLRY